MRKKVKLESAYRLVAPGPLVLVSSMHGKRVAITPIAWHMPVSDDPPIIALEISEDHYIYEAIMKTGDFVINVPSSDMADVCRILGSISGRKVEKFDEFDLKKQKSKKVKSPRLGNAIAVLECKLRRDKSLLKKYNVVLGDVVYAEAEKGLFKDRWLSEKKGKRFMHHLGGKVFYSPEKRIF